jgi:hypothetical protein
MSLKRWSFETKYGDEMELIVFDSGTVRLKHGGLMASGDDIEVKEYSDHKKVILWAGDDHISSSVNVEKYVGRRLEIECGRMQSSFGL